ncbi:hypothetical protein ACTXT7_012346, partial [Hymenolepis weldensis]
MQLLGFPSEEVIILGAFDGTVYAFPLEEGTKWRPIFNVPSPQSVSHFSMMYHIPSLENENVNGDIEECLFGITDDGLVAACYSIPNQGRHLVFYRIPSLDPNKRRSFTCTPQGSWLHILSSDGFLLSFMFAHIDGRLICTPAVYPQKPSFRHIDPYTGSIYKPKSHSEVGTINFNITSSSEEFDVALKWRSLNIKDLITLPGGQIGAVNQDTGNDLPLTDYISRYQSPDVSNKASSKYISPLRSEVIFSRLHRAVADNIFLRLPSDQTILRTTVRLKSLQDLPGYCEFHTDKDSSNLAMIVQINLPPSDDAGIDYSEWMDFKEISLSQLLRLTLKENPESLADEIRRLRESLRIVVEVRPVTNSSNLSHSYTERWISSDSVNGTYRKIIYHLPESFFRWESDNYNLEISVYLELDYCSTGFIIYSPLRCKLHHRVTTAIDLLRYHEISSISLPYSLPVRLSSNMLSKFEELFRSYGFPIEEDRRKLTFQYLASSNPKGLEVCLDVEKSGFKISSSDLSLLIQLYEAFQHHIKQFFDQQFDSVTVDNLRREYALLESMEVHLSRRQTTNDIQGCLNAELPPLQLPAGTYNPVNKRVIYV